VCVLVGPSGSGKTTAMRLMNRVIPVSGGDILLGGKSVLHRDPRELRREIGYVIQQMACSRIARQELDKAVIIDKQSAATVAQQFLQANRLS
jgi:ABC-type proline/glycine betaine transport system ATPase subunit